MWLRMPEKSLTTPLKKRVCLLLPWRNILVKTIFGLFYNIFVVQLFQNTKICPGKLLLKKCHFSTESLCFRTVSNKRNSCSWRSSLSLAPAMGLLDHQGHRFLFAVPHPLKYHSWAFALPRVPQGGLSQPLLGSMSTPRAGHSPAQGDRGRLRLKLGSLNFHISIPSTWCRVSVSIRDQDNFDQVILFCNTFFHCCMIPSSCLEPSHNELSPCFQSSVLWGKRKQDNHKAGTRESFFFFFF